MSSRIMSSSIMSSRYKNQTKMCVCVCDALSALFLKQNYSGRLFLLGVAFFQSYDSVQDRFCFRRIEIEREEPESL